MGTDLGTVNKRLNQIIALLGSHANLSEVAKNTYVPTGQTVLSCTSWGAELQTANTGLDYTYRTAFPHPLYAAAEEGNTVYHLHPFRWEFPTTKAGMGLHRHKHHTILSKASEVKAICWHGSLGRHQSIPVITRDNRTSNCKHGAGDWARMSFGLRY